MRNRRGSWRDRGVASAAAAAVLGTVLGLGGPVAASSSAHDSTTTTLPSSTSTTSLPGSTSSTTSTSTSSTTTTSPPPLSLTWPSSESAAVLDPGLFLAAASPRQPVVPIASITKLMTTWVVLHHMPLAVGQRGPCHVISAHDVAVYKHDVITDQSSAAVALNENICERTLLRGVLVHSAGNFAEILAAMTGWSHRTFVRVMNRDARVLGLSHTHYVEVTGIDSRDRSTASDQVRLASLLMSAEPVVASIVRLPQVHLPVAGTLASYTPFVGQGGVVGVKSGYTIDAGGCDVMAINFHVGTFKTTVYVAVLGDHGPNGIVGSAQTALNLARQLRRGIRVIGPASDRHMVWTGTPDYYVGTTTTSTTSTSTTSTTVPGTSTTTSTTLP